MVRVIFCLSPRWRRMRPRKSIRASALPRLRCRHCRRKLVQVDVHDGWTCLRLAGGVPLVAVLAAVGGTGLWAADLLPSFPSPQPLENLS